MNIYWFFKPKCHTKYLSAWNSLGYQSLWTHLHFAIACDQCHASLLSWAALWFEQICSFRDLLLKCIEWVWAAISPEGRRVAGDIALFFFFTKLTGVVLLMITSEIILSPWTERGWLWKYLGNYSLKFRGNDWLWSKASEGSCNGKNK